MLMFMKDKQREKKRASRIERPMGLEDRVPLTAYFPGMSLTGTVISLTNFGAYVDVGTECDGLLHVSQMSRDIFVCSIKRTMRIEFL
jgi:transcriptional accessory protein Tex/SPT6